MLEQSNKPIKPWQPFKMIQLFRPDGSPDLGISRILFESNSYYKNAEKTTTFWAGSFEGELLQIDWDVKVAKEEAQAEDGKPHRVENVIKYFEGEMNWRPVLAIDRKSTRLNSSHIPLFRMPSSA